MTMLYLVFGIG